ncbi:MAG TPA: efflux transporter outer membrane subunit [Dokdonella sp.]
MNASRALFAAALLAALVACKTVGPEYRLPESAAINRPSAAAAFADADSAAVSIAPVPDDWWKLYDDAVLERLIRDALASNTDLRVAAANLRRMASAYDAARHAGGFDATVSADVQRTRIAGESLLMFEQLPVASMADAGIDVSYEFDLFGKLKRGAEAARADAQAAAAAHDLARITVVAAVARSYMEVCHAGHEIEIERGSLELQRRSADVAQRLLDAGRGTSTDAARARAQVARLEARLPPLEAEKKAAEYALAALLGQTPGAAADDVDRCTEAPSLKQPLPVGDGAALLRRRPDVREAERQLAGATARIGVATAELYPDVRIGASAGVLGLLDDAGEAPTRHWGIGPLITWTLPSRSAHARVRIAEAGADAALARFDGVVLGALRETQTALERYREDLQRRDALAHAVAEAHVAADNNRRLYQAGRAPYLESLDASRESAGADASLAQAEAQVSLDQVALFLALGGGWQSAANAETAAVDASGAPRGR